MVTAITITTRSVETKTPPVLVAGGVFVLLP
jgi:hypothetical protein